MSVADSIYQPLPSSASEPVIWAALELRGHGTCAFGLSRFDELEAGF